MKPVRLIPFGVIKWVLYLARLGHLYKSLGGEVQDSTFLRFQGHVDYLLVLGAIPDERYKPISGIVMESHLVGGYTILKFSSIGR